MTAMQHTIATHAGQTPAMDASGYGIFSSGAAGQAHVMAHQWLDRGQIATGYSQLGDWLDGRQSTAAGSDSDGIHLNFHQAVFEIEAGDWTAAYKRYLDEVLPYATDGARALSDAPQLAWRLALSAPRPMDLHWDVLRAGALANTAMTIGDWEQLHLMLAIAGSGDTQNLARWDNTGLTGRFSQLLKARAQGDFSRAGEGMKTLLPAIQQAGGSRAQNQLFELIGESERSTTTFSTTT